MKVIDIGGMVRVELNEYPIKQQEKELKIVLDFYSVIGYNGIMKARNMKTNTDNRTEERKNRFNGESVMLTKEEARRHDKLFMHEIMSTLED